jgi:hypothetical protein
MSEFFASLFPQTVLEIQQRTSDSKRNKLCSNHSKFLKVSSDFLSVSHLTASPLQTDAVKKQK